MRSHQSRTSTNRTVLIIGHVLLGTLLGICLAGVFGLATQVLWNYVIPTLFPVPAISFKQAVALVILTRILFGRIGGSRKHHRLLHRNHRITDCAHADESCRCWSKPYCDCSGNLTGNQS